jgi:hypothetical protein
MVRTLEIEWPDLDVSIGAQLFDEENPELCERFWQGLPFTTMFTASMSAGEIFKVPLPVSLPLVEPEKMVPVVEQPPGSIIGMVGVGSALFVLYGRVVEPWRFPRLGKVLDHDIDTLRTIAVKLRDAYFFTKQICFAEIRAKE